MTPALASESAAARMVACGGMVTRTGAPVPGPQVAAVTIRTAMLPRRTRKKRKLPTPRRTRRPPTPRRRSAVETQGMLQENGLGQRVHVALSVARRAAHFIDGPQRGGRRVPLVHQPRG